jgi:hypothetical protein
MAEEDRVEIELETLPAARKTTTRSGLPCSSICLLRIGPAARPCFSRNAGTTGMALGKQPGESIGTGGATFN